MYLQKRGYVKETGKRVHSEGYSCDVIIEGKSKRETLKLYVVEREKL